MNRRPDPWWLVHVDRAYGVLLYLYPRRFRQVWSEPMRQALRDRCRDLAQAQRNPAPWICTDLLPDLAASAGREQWITFEEETTMKRMSLLMLLLLGSVALLGWSKTSSVGSELLFSTSQWIQNRERRALESAYADYHLDLVRTALASDRPDERALAYPLAQLRTGSADAGADLAATQTQLDRLPAAVTSTRLGEFLAAASCRSPSALTRLQAAEPDNGAIWALTVTCRQQAGDATGARAALLRLVQSTRYDSRSGALLVALTDVLQRKPLPSALERVGFPPERAFLLTTLWLAHDPERDGTSQLCWPNQRGATDAALRADCRAAAAVLAASADSELQRRVGLFRIAIADGQTVNEVERAVARDRLHASLRAWWQLPSERRAVLAASGADERALLARAGGSTSPLQ